MIACPFLSVLTGATGYPAGHLCDKTLKHTSPLACLDCPDRPQPETPDQEADQDAVQQEHVLHLRPGQARWLQSLGVPVRP